jgi:serine/threonine protein kinase
LLSLSSTTPVRAQVADFGLSRSVADKISGMLGSWQWMAPEVIDANNNLFDETADTYSFGIVIWEIMSGGKLPFEEYITEERFCNRVAGPNGTEVMALRVTNIKQAIISEHLRPTIPRDWPPLLATMLRECWDPEPHKRPTFDAILRVLCSVSGIPLPPAALDTGIVALRHYSIETPKTDDPEELDIINVTSTQTANITSMPAAATATSSSLAIPTFRTTVTLVGSETLDERIFCSALVGDDLWIGGSAGTIYVFSCQHLVLKHKWPAHQQRVYTLVSTNNNEVWSGSEDGWLKIWSAEDFHLVRDIRHSAKQRFIKCIIHVTTSSGKETMWVGLPVTGEIRVWDVTV